MSKYNFDIGIGACVRTSGIYSCGAHRGVKSVDARLGELFPARHRVSETERPRRVDTVPPAVLHLEAMETAQTPPTRIPSIGYPAWLGAPVCLLPKGRLAAVLQSRYGDARHRGTLARTRLHSIPGVLSCLKVRKNPRKGVTLVR